MFGLHFVRGGSASKFSRLAAICRTISATKSQLRRLKYTRPGYSSDWGEEELLSLFLYLRGAWKSLSILEAKFRLIPNGMELVYDLYINVQEL